MEATLFFYYRSSFTLSLLHMHDLSLTTFFTLFTATGGIHSEWIKYLHNESVQINCDKFVTTSIASFTKQNLVLRWRHLEF